MVFVLCGRLSDDRHSCPYKKIAVEKPHSAKPSQQLVRLPSDTVLDFAARACG